MLVVPMKFLKKKETGLLSLMSWLRYVVDVSYFARIGNYIVTMHYIFLSSYVLSAHSVICMVFSSYFIFWLASLFARQQDCLLLLQLISNEVIE